MSETDALFAALGDARKAVQRPAAESVAARLGAGTLERARVAALLEADDPRLRWGAAYALAMAEPAPLDVVPVLVETLGGADGDLRWASATILVRIADGSPTVGATLRTLVRTSSGARRKMALYCLRDARMQGADVERDVAAALADPDAAVRLAAMAAMAALAADPAHAADAVAGLVDDAEAGVRRAATATLGRLGADTPGVRTALARAARSDDESLRRVAEGAISRLDASARR